MDVINFETQSIQYQKQELARFEKRLIVKCDEYSSKLDSFHACNKAIGDLTLDSKVRERAFVQLKKIQTEFPQTPDGIELIHGLSFQQLRANRLRTKILKKYLKSK
jgi:hypothetical protein